MSGIGPISDYDFWKLASPYDAEPEPEEDYDGDDDADDDEYRHPDD